MDLKFSQLVPAGVLAPADLLCISQAPVGPGSSKSILASDISAFLVSEGDFVQTSGDNMSGLLHIDLGTQAVGPGTALRAEAIFDDGGAGTQDFYLVTLKTSTISASGATVLQVLNSADAQVFTIQTDGSIISSADIIGNTLSIGSIINGGNYNGYTPESNANKSTDGTFAANSDILYPSQKATKTYVDAQVAGVTPPFLDTNALIKGSADATKLLRFEVDGFTTGNTRVLTPPDQNGTLALLERAQTFTQQQTIALGTITTDVQNLSATATWNAAGVTFTALKLNITDTASAAASKFLEFLVGADSKFLVDKSGNIALDGSIEFLFGSTNKIFLSNNRIVFSHAGGETIGSYSGGVIIRSSLAFGWSSSGSVAGGTFDLTLFRDEANVLAQRNGVNAQEFRLYNTFTSSTNFERLTLCWASSALIIRTEVGSGGGTIRSLTIGTGAAVGTNIAGVDTALVGGQSTGTGLGGGIIFRTSPAGGAGSGVNALVTQLSINSAGLATFTGDVTMSLAKKLTFGSGSNQRAGNLTLVAGTQTISNTSVTANSIILLTRKTSGGTIGLAITYTVSAATSFTVTSDNALDTSTFSYAIFEVV